MTIQVQESKIQSVVDSAIEKHGSSREALIPILSQINREFGFIPAGAFKEIRRQIHLPENQVFVSESQLFSLASFYHMLSTEPVGRHVVRFCESAPCHVEGGRELFQALKENLGLEPGETSADNKWTFMTTSCLGVCAVGPVILVDEEIYGNVKPEHLPEILNRYE